jgi:hypothetical protein
MNPTVTALWGSVILSGLTVLLGIAWFATGRKKRPLQLMFGISAILSSLCFGYVQFYAS